MLFAEDKLTNPSPRVSSCDGSSQVLPFTLQETLAPWALTFPESCQLSLTYEPMNISSPHLF